MLFEEADANLFVELLCDRTHQALEQLFLHGLILHRLHLLDAGNGLVEQLLHVLERVLVHLVDATHVSDREVEDGASFGDASVEVSRLVDDDLDLPRAAPRGQLG